MKSRHQSKYFNPFSFLQRNPHSMMASGFDRGRNACEGVGCRATTEVIYYVEEKKQFCEECATKARCVGKERKVKLDAFCEKHEKPISIHCKTHDVSVCQLCAMISHMQLDCVRQDVEDAILQKKQLLEDLQVRVRDKVTAWQEGCDALRLCQEDTDRHLKSVKDEVDVVVDDEIAKISDKMRRDAALINKEADDAIRRINARRAMRLKRYHEHRHKQLNVIEDKRRELHNDITSTANVARAKIVELQNQARCLMHSIEETSEMIERLLKNDKELVKCARGRIASLSERLGKAAVDKGVVENITRTVQGVRFIKGVGDIKYNGRIGGYDGKWELSENIGIRDDVKFLIIVGCLQGTCTIMTNYAWPGGDAYMFDPSNKIVRKVIASDRCSLVWSCAVLNEDTIVCGMYKDSGCKGGDTLDDCVRLYDRMWKLTKNIAIPHNTSDTCAWVDVAVDNDGMIIAAERHQSHIYVINPENGATVGSISCTFTTTMNGVLSTGDIIAQHVEIDDKLLIIDRKGIQKEITLGGEILSCAIDPLTDDLFPVHWDATRKVCVVDRVSSRGEIVETNLLEYRAREEESKYSRLIMTSRGRLILCDGREYQVHQKRISL